MLLPHTSGAEWPVTVSLESPVCALPNAGRAL